MPGEQSIQALQQRCSNLERDLDNALKMLRERDEVLGWASDKVVEASRHPLRDTQFVPKAWVCFYETKGLVVEETIMTSEPHNTLYEALLAAYKESKQ